MFDEDGIDDFNNVNTAPRAANDNFQRVKALEIREKTKTLVRIPPRRADRAPKGYWPLLRHYVRSTKTGEPIEVKCNKTGDLKNECVLCDVFKGVQALGSKIPGSIQKDIEKSLTAGDLLLPVIGYFKLLNEQERIHPESGNKWIAREWGAGDPKDPEQEKSYLLVFKLGPQYTENFFKNQFMKLDEVVAREDKKGQYLLFEREAKYNFYLQESGKPTPLRKPELLEKFPNFPGWLADIEMDNYGMQELLKECYFWDVIKKYIKFEEEEEVDLSRMEPDLDGLEDLI